MTLSQSILADFDAEAARTRRLLEAVPIDQLGWRPHESSMTLGELTGHIAETPSWVGSLVEDELDAAAGAAWDAFVPRDGAELLDVFDRNVRLFQSALRHRDDAQLRATWSLVSNGEVVLSQPKHVAIREQCLHHWIHHRGQLTVYLRLVGTPVPSSYGPTADVPDALA